MAEIRRFAPRVLGLLALAALLVGVPVFAQSAVVASTNPATLDYGNLRTAWIAVNLAGATYESAADTAELGAAARRMAQAEIDQRFSPPSRAIVTPRVN